jgi:hypothetical protein
MNLKYLIGSANERECTRIREKVQVAVQRRCHVVFDLVNIRVYLRSFAD